MPIGNLLKSQSNEIYLAIIENGWNASDFEWANLNIKEKGVIFECPRLKHKNSDYYFTFYPLEYSQKFLVAFSPGFQSLRQRKENANWAGQLDAFTSWLYYLSREVNAPDLWDELPSETELIESTSSENDNSKFNEEESKLIVKGMEEIKQYLLTAHKLDPELIEGQLKYLVESSERLGRKDWKNALIAVLFSIIIEGGIAGHTAQEIFQFVWTILQTVLIQKVYLP